MKYLKKFENFVITPVKTNLNLDKLVIKEALSNRFITHDQANSDFK
jgi:hypothetical protein